MIAKLVLQTFVWFGVMGALMFGPAGTLHWAAAWVY
ncbi:MAG: isoprenylcysteine carboxylmethyltransferase family protein, partial [Mesorhizobium sp.]